MTRALDIASFVDGIIVLNRGGLVAAASRSTHYREIIELAGAQMPALVGSGFRRGPISSRPMGAEAVCIGHIWCLGAFNRPGVERVLEMLCVETPMAMQRVGDLPHPKILRNDQTEAILLTAVARSRPTEGYYGP